MLKITTGNNGYEVLASGTVITYNNESLTLFLTDELKIKLTFTPDDKITMVLTGCRADSSNKELELALKVFQGSLLAGSTAPMHVAVIDNKNIYFSFIISALAKVESKAIHYTFYSREEH